MGQPRHEIFTQHLIKTTAKVKKKELLVAANNPNTKHLKEFCSGLTAVSESVWL